jgi:hypothetical protein
LWFNTNRDVSTKKKKSKLSVATPRSKILDKYHGLWYKKVCVPAVWTTYLFKFIYFWSDNVKHFFHDPTSFHRLMAIFLNEIKICIRAYNLTDTELIKPCFDFKSNRYITIIMVFYFIPVMNILSTDSEYVFHGYHEDSFFLDVSGQAEGTKILQNVRIYSPSDTASHPRHSNASHLWRPQILHCYHGYNCWQYFIHNVYIHLLSIAILNFTCLTPIPH